MKPLFVLVCLCGIALTSFSQKRDLFWMQCSYNGIWPRGAIDFSSGIAEIITVDRPMGMLHTANLTMGDTSGQAIYWTNGVTIENRFAESMKNSKNFNPGFWTDYYGEYGLAITQAIVSLPMPEHDSLYAVFHVSAENIFSNNLFDAQPLRLSGTVINMNLDSSRGAVVKGLKNVTLIDDTLVNGRLTACKHGNGRDWWVITQEYFSNRYYKLLLSKDTVYLKDEQPIGYTPEEQDIIGQAVFSPDGSKYAVISRTDTIQFLDFDRCTGEFSNPVTLVVPDSVFSSIGLAFSPSGRYLYASTFWHVVQFDTWAMDIQSSVDTVAVFDQTFDSLAVNLPFDFAYMALAPDKRIYIHTWNSTTRLHYIEFPDSAGDACNVVQHSFALPSYNFSLPNHPNYDLGRLLGAPCDTLTAIEEVVAPDHFRIYPNPASESINIVYDVQQHALFELFDLWGRKVTATTLYSYHKNRVVHVNELPPGLYSYSITSLQAQLQSGKIVIE